MSFGSKLKEIRDARGIGLRQLSRDSGLAIGHLQYLEGDARVPGDSTLRKLAHGLDVPVEQLRGERTASQVSILLKEAGPLTDEQREELLKVIDETLGPPRPPARKRRSTPRRKK